MDSELLYYSTAAGEKDTDNVSTVENIDPSPNHKTALGGMKLDTTSDNNGAISGEKPTLSQILGLSLTTCLACHVWLSLPDAGFIADQVGL